jgi:hypothetical protein
MTSWEEFEAAAPELAATILERFGAHKHAVIATLKADGSPRLSGIETAFWRGDLWIGMMPESRKGADLRRDPRFSLHSAPIDLELVDGDAKLAGRAALVTDAALVAEFLAASEESTRDVPPGAVDLFRAELLEASLVTVAGDHLVVDSWVDGGSPTRRTRT